MLTVANIFWRGMFVRMVGNYGLWGMGCLAVCMEDQDEC